MSLTSSSYCTNQTIYFVLMTANKLRRGNSLTGSGTKWKVISKMSIKEEDLCGVLCCIHLAYDVDLWWAVVNLVIDVWVS